MDVAAFLATLPPFDGVQRLEPSTDLAKDAVLDAEVTLPLAPDVDGDVAVKLATTCKSFGELITEYSGDLVDGKVSGNELRRIEREGAELIADVHALLAHATSLYEQAKPAALRVAR